MQNQTAISAQEVSAQGSNTFDSMVVALQAHFNEVLERNGPHLFYVETGVDLYQLYLDKLPAERQHYTCRCCQNFIRLFGSLASVNEDGTLTSAIWAPDRVSECFAGSVAAMARAVARGKVSGVALFSEEIWGKPLSGGWTHFAIQSPDNIVFDATGALTAEQAMAAKLQDYGTLVRGLSEFKREEVAQALTLLEGDALYRCEKVLGHAQFLLKLYDVRAEHAGRNRDNLTWRFVAGAPAGFCQPRSTMIGTLLEDIAAGKSFAEIQRQFNSKMDPLFYQRPQAAPKAGNIEQAEKLVAKLGLEPALRRRFARLDEIKTIWKPRAETKAALPGGVFGHLRPKGQQPAQPLSTPVQAITWEKFARTVLPNAHKIEVYMTDTMSLCGLVTAADPEAPPIIQWDSKEERNPFSWYVYKGGSQPENWNLRTGTWAKVAAVTLQPSMWAGEELFAHQGKSAIFVLEGAQDKCKSGLSLFPEILKPSLLHAVRATIEAHSKSREIEGTQEASANGLRVGNMGCNSRIRVTTAIGVATYAIDRWD